MYVEMEIAQINIRSAAET